MSLPAAVSSAVYNANNQLKNWNGKAFDYDLNGNLFTDSSNAYSWNTRNQLVSMRPDGGLPKSSYVYDGLGRRQSKLVNGTYTRFLYDETGNIIAESVDAGQMTTFDVSTLAPDELVCQYQTDGGQSATLLPITDPSNMSIIGLLSDGGAIRASYSYEPYGSVTYVGDAGTDQQYTGREDDIPGVLQYNRWRYYLPAQGRFISEDPIGSAGGMNLYRYADGNPMTLRDPSGQHWERAAEICEVWGEAAGEIIERCTQTVWQGLCAGALTVVTYVTIKDNKCDCVCGSGKNTTSLGRLADFDCRANCAMDHKFKYNDYSCK